MPKQFQNNFAVVSGATIMLIISAMIYKNLEGEGEQSHHNTECISYLLITNNTKYRDIATESDHTTLIITQLS